MLPSHNQCLRTHSQSRRSRPHPKATTVPFCLFHQVGGPVGGLQGVIQKAQLAGGFIVLPLQGGDIDGGKDLDLGAGGAVGILAGFLHQAAVGFRPQGEHIAAGDELAMVYPADGTSCVPDGCAILNGAPHEENARVFVDFTVSRDVQQLIQEQFCRRSVRSDLEPAGELPSFGRIAQVDYDVSLASENRESVLMSWAFYQETEETP